MNTLRPLMSPLARAVRAYFAPVDRTAAAPTLFDPARAFDSDAPPAPWLHLGWIENFRRTPGTRVQAVRCGARGAAVAQFRSQLDARVEFDFLDWGKLQMALAGGSQHMNVLEGQGSALARPSGGAAVPAVPLAAGSTSAELLFDPGGVDSFAEGDLLAVDVDYAGQTGYVGSGLAAAWVRDPADVGNDPDYIRRVTFNLGRVAEKQSSSLVLDAPLPGGAPPAGAAVQKAVAFVDREGGSFWQEWSALFLIPQESGGRICFFYPRLQPATPAQEQALEIAAPLHAWSLRASFIALPHTDSNDNEQVVCYRSYVPAARAPAF